MVGHNENGLLASHKGKFPMLQDGFEMMKFVAHIRVFFAICILFVSAFNTFDPLIVNLSCAFSVDVVSEL